MSYAVNFERRQVRRVGFGDGMTGLISEIATEDGPVSGVKAVVFQRFTTILLNIRARDAPPPCGSHSTIGTPCRRTSGRSSRVQRAQESSHIVPARSALHRLICRASSGS